MYRSNRITLDIEWAHCDPAGIVWNPRFFEFFDTGTWRLFETVLGVPRAELNARYDLLGLALVSAGATFTSPLKFGDQGELETTIVEFRRSSFSVRHRISKAGKLAIEGEEKRVWAVRHPDDPTRLSTKSIPPEVIERFAAA